MPRTPEQRAARAARRARRSVTAVRQLHSWIDCVDGTRICKECGEEFPCMTIQVIQQARSSTS